MNGQAPGTLFLFPNTHTWLFSFSSTSLEGGGGCRRKREIEMRHRFKTQKKGNEGGSIYVYIVLDKPRECAGRFRASIKTRKQKEWESEEPRATRQEHFYWNSAREGEKCRCEPQGPFFFSSFKCRTQPFITLLFWICCAYPWLFLPILKDPVRAYLTCVTDTVDMITLCPPGGGGHTKGMIEFKPDWMQYFPACTDLWMTRTTHVSP